MCLVKRRSLSLSLSVVALFCVLSGDAVVAQNTNVTLLKRHDTRGRLSGVWGYTAPDGREFALVGDYSGTWIVETTDPVAPIERGYFSAPNSRWREITSFKTSVYSVSEHHRGIRIIDMMNPAQPVDKGYLFTANITRAHSISVDPDAGRIYANGTANGVVIIDVSTTPLSPKILGYYRTSYVHDCYVRRGKGYFCHIRSGDLRIVDVTNPASIPQTSIFKTPLRLPHNAWATDDDKLLVVTDERQAGSDMTVYDISNPKLPVRKGSYGPHPNEITHNAHIIGRTCYIAYDSAGFHMCDLADPLRPTKLASYDTSATTSGYNGAWGCYPFTDSGHIYMSDRDNGLMILQVDCGHMNRFGKGIAPAGHAVPRAHWDMASPKVGASKLELRIANLQPNAAWALALAGKSVTPFTLLGVDVNIDLTGALWIYGKADANGKTTLNAPVPNDATLGGKKIYMQLFAADNLAPQGFAASRGMWSGICK